MTIVCGRNIEKRSKLKYASCGNVWGSTIPLNVGEKGAVRKTLVIIWQRYLHLNDSIAWIARLICQTLN
jgi:hypothetical protein